MSSGANGDRTKASDELPVVMTTSAPYTVDDESDGSVSDVSTLDVNYSLDVVEEGAEVDCVRDVSREVDLALRSTPNPTTINMENSNNVHIGPRLNYNAPVTINQFVNVNKNDGGEGKDSEEQALKAAAFINGTVLERDRGWHVLHRRQLLIWGCVVVLIATVIIVAVVLHFSLSGSGGGGDGSSNLHGYISIPSEQPPPDTTPDPTLVLNQNQNVYTRDYWSNYEPRFRRPLPHPTPYVVISHSAERTCADPIDCSQILRGIQSYHVSSFDQPDIGYNFMIDSAGNVYEGRGWDSTNFFGEFVTRRNVGICILGNYVFLEFSEKQQKALKDLIDLGLNLDKIANDYKLIAHNQILATDSPGKNILKVIDSWPHRCLSDCAIPFNVSTSTESPVTSPVSPTEGTRL